MNDKLEIYLSHKVAQTKNNVEHCENYFAEKHTFHGGWSKGYLKGRLSALEDILGMLGGEKEAFEKGGVIMSKWISVEERLPLKQRGGCSGVVDIWIENERWPNCYYYFEEEEWYDADMEEVISHKVTHWMKIPSPPEV